MKKQSISHSFRHIGKYLFILFSLPLMLRCGSEPGNVKSELADLKKQKEEIEQKIETLTKELPVDSTTVRTKGKTVSIKTIDYQSLQYITETQGRVASQSSSSVSPKTAGVVTHVLKKEGEIVRKGEALASLDRSVIKSSIDEIVSSLELASSIYERQKKLWDQNIGTEVQFLEAQTNKKTLESRLISMKRQLGFYTIKAPISGRIEAVNIKVGEAVIPGLPAFVVTNLTDIKVVVSLSEAYIGKITKNNRATVIFPESNKTISSNVSFVGNNIDPTTRSFPVEIKLSKNRDIYLNMTAHVQIIYQTIQQALCVPINVIQTSKDEKYVYLAKEEGPIWIAHKQLIKIAGISGSLAQIEQGINPGDKIIIIGYQSLNDGDPVTIL